MLTPISRRAGVGLAFCLFCTPLSAEDVQGARLSIELNAADQVEDSCRISFLIQNGYPFDIDKAEFEAVLFDDEGRVDRLNLFDFGALPTARPRLRQFVVPGLACESLGRVLINGATTCAGETVPAGACDAGLDLHSRTEIEVLG